MRTPTVMLVLAGSLLGQQSAAEDKFSIQHMHYQENDERMKVGYTTLGLEKDFGTDYTIKLDYGYDAISGATPVWKNHPKQAGEFQEGLQNIPAETRQSASGAFTLRDSLRNEYTVAAAYSYEPDFISRELSAQAMLWEDELHNRSYSIGAAWQDNTSVASEFTNHSSNAHSHILNYQAGVTQVIDASSSLEFSVYGGHERGYLSNHYLKIVRKAMDGNHLDFDHRPDWRDSGGIALRHLRAWQPSLSSNLWYRFYQDNWSIQAHTVEAKLYWDLSSWLRLNPVLRHHQQTGANFYRGYRDNPSWFAPRGYGSSDARLGAFSAQTAQLNVEFKADKSYSLNIGGSYYQQNNGFSAWWLSTGLVWKL